MLNRKKFYKRSDITPKDPTQSFILKNTELIVNGGFVIGWDPPSGKNLGWAVFQYNDNLANYIDSGVEQIVDNEDERLLCVYNFVNNLNKKYQPLIASIIERAIGFGWAPAREKLGENTGIIKFASFLSGSEVKPVHTNSMGELFTKSGKKKRAEKKIAIQEQAKRYFPISLKSRRITQTGKFTHEADAIGYCVGFFIANGININCEMEESDV
jgi:Holliday junction resolvasome RuvABC endonuclease subunit